MYLKDLSKIIYDEGTASENRDIVVKTHSEGKVLWKGKAKYLQTMSNIGGWLVVEILINESTEKEGIPDYNWGKIITVI